MPPGSRIVLMLVLLWIAGCESQYQENWGRLKPGLTKPQVEELLGPPSSRYEPRSDGAKAVIAQERWQWGDNLSSLATGAVFPGEPHPHAWVVWFDEKGRVASFQSADWAGGRDGP